MKYPREFEVREIMLKAHTDTGSHLKFKELFKRKWKWDINEIKWQMMWDRCSINESFE